MEDLVEKIGNLYYDKHAIERMRTRNLFPCIIEHVVQTGDHYKLKVNGKEAKGGTDAYIKFGIANILPGGSIGERIISIEPNKTKRYQHVVVLTGLNGIVKTAYVADDSRVKAFIKNNCKTLKASDGT